VQVIRRKEELDIILFQPEAHLMKRSLDEIYSNYRTKPEDLPESIKQLWHSHACELEPEDRKIWLEHLSEFRGFNSQLIQRLSVQLDGIKNWPVILTVSLQEADSLLTILNDQRLYLAAAHEVGEQEMNQDWEVVIQSPEKQVVVNIHFLAWLIELVIMRLDHLPEC